jgi:hypothetical protein
LPPRVHIAAILLVLFFVGLPGGCFARSAGDSFLAPVNQAALAEQDRVAQLRARFDKEPDPVHKAKLMVPLGTAEFDRVEKEIGDNELSAALGGLREYQGQASACGKALDARGVNPEKHPAGYKELQISVRESLRRLDTMLVSLSGDDQKPFQEIRKTLEELNRDLIKELFPK